jgi:hypothetical protein
MSVEGAMREIRAIEGLIEPYEYEAYEARRVLTALRDLKEALGKMDKERIKRVINEISGLEGLAAPYRGYGFVEEALLHARNLLNELKKIVGE